MTDIHPTHKEPNLHDTTDASVWAAEFCKRWTTALCQIEGREGVETEENFKEIMLGWFANAIMAGVDSEARKHVGINYDMAEAPRDEPIDLYAKFGGAGHVRIPDMYWCKARKDWYDKASWRWDRMSATAKLVGWSRILKPEPRG